MVTIKDAEVGVLSMTCDEGCEAMYHIHATSYRELRGRSPSYIENGWWSRPRVDGEPRDERENTVAEKPNHRWLVAWNGVKTLIVFREFSTIEISRQAGIGKGRGAPGEAFWCTE